MKRQAVRFLSLLFAALAMSPAMAHLLEAPNKMGLSREEYLIVQQIYRGWALLGIVVLGALLSTLALTVLARGRGREFRWALFAFVCVAGTQANFWTFTFPANQQTRNWTVLPENWQNLRRRWEYSHAASAALNLLAFTGVSVSVLSAGKDRRTD